MGLRCGPSAGSRLARWDNIPTIPFSLWRGWTHDNVTEASPAPQRLTDPPWPPTKSSLGFFPSPGPAQAPALGAHRAWRSEPCAFAGCAPAAGGCGWGWLRPSGAQWLHAGTPGSPGTQTRCPHLSVSLGASLPTASHLPADHTPSLNTLPCSPFENSLSRPHSDPRHTPGRKGEEHGPAGGAGASEHAEREAKGHLR